MTNYRILLATGISVLAFVLQSGVLAAPAYAAVNGTPSSGPVPEAQAAGTVSGAQSGGTVPPVQTGGTVPGAQSGGTVTGVQCTNPMDGTTVTCAAGYSCDTYAGVCIAPPSAQSGGTVPGAQSGGTAPQTSASGLINPLGAGTSLTTLIADIMSLVTRVGIVIVILMLVYVGFLFVTAQGNESKLTQAKTALMWTVIGALILLGAQAIAYGIQATAQALSVGG